MTASPPLNAPLLFADLVDLLRRQGFPIGVDHYVRLYALLDRVGDSTEPTQLKTLLCPIFATSREQQDQFHVAFEQCFGAFGTRHPRLDVAATDDGALISGAIRPEPKHRARTVGRVRKAGDIGKTAFRWLAVYALVLVVEFVLLVGIPVAMTLTMVRSDARSDRAASARTVREAPSTPVTADSTGRNGRIAAAPKVSLPNPPPAARRRYTKQEADTLFKSVWDATTGRFLSTLGELVVILLPLVGVIGLEVARYRRRRPSLHADAWKRPPFVWPIRVAGVTNPFLRSDSLPAVARTLRRRAANAEVVFDVERTINATVAALGFPTFRHRSITRPSEYLVLIERSAFHDHQAALFNSLFAALDHEGVVTSRYYYDGDPRTCYRETGEASVLLAELQRKNPGHHLLVVGTGERFLDPITGKLLPWTGLFEAWQDRALLTPEPVENWSFTQITLARRFVVLPATLAGLGEVRDAFERMSDSGGSTPFGVASDASELRAGSTERAIARHLRASLGDDVHRWMCVCAIYPELHWDLTLRLGTLPQLGARVLTESNLLRIARIPWFRAGSIPDDVRAILIRELDPAVAVDARVAIIDVLERNPPPRESAARREYELELAVQRFAIAPSDRRRRRQLMSAMKAAPPRHVRRQLTFVRLVEPSSQTSPTLVLPSRLRRPLLRRAVPRFTLPRLNIPRLAFPVAGAVAAGAVLAALMTISFVGNRRLQRSVDLAMAAAAALPERMTAVPSGGDLARLDSLREQVEVLSRHVHDGPPLWLRWGLYSGERMYPPARALYFDKFARVLYDSTRAGLRRATISLTAPNATVPYDSAYRLLRAYLVTTDDHERSTREFVGPALENAWPQRSVVDSATRGLAGRQFEFFGSELPYGNPFADRGDASLIGSARAVLAKSSGITPIYIAMLTEASRRGQPVRLGAPGAGALVNSAAVPAQFTKSSWTYFVDTALTKDLDRFLVGEPWVTGGIIALPADRNQLARDLRKRYTDDYVGAWRRYVSSASIAGFANLEDAAQRIDVLAGPTSPLLRMLLTVSENAVVDIGVRVALQPVEIVMPLENKDKYIGGANQEYLDQLGALATAVHQVADVRPGADPLDQLQAASIAAAGVRSAVGKLSRRFAAEPERQIALRRLLLMPAERVERLIQLNVVAQQKSGGASAINAAAAAFCAETRDVLEKFPFARAQAQATGAELAKLFRPAGTIAQFYQQSLAGKVLTRAGAGYAAASGGSMPTDQLLRFMNNAQRITDAVFPGGASEPRVQFTLRPQLTESVPILTMTFGDETFQFARGGERSITGTWRFKDDDGVEFLRRGSNRIRDNGPWAPFRMYWDDAKPGAVAGTKTYDIFFGQARATLEMSVGGGLSDPAFFSGLTCPVQAVR